MQNDTPPRRAFFKFAAAGALATGGIALSSGKAWAYQGNMENALGALNAALEDLHRATSDKGGHKSAAVALIQQAMGEVQAGIDFAAEHGGD